MVRMYKDAFELTLVNIEDMYSATVVKTFEAELFSVKIGGTTLIASYKELFSFLWAFFII
ncbi:hypothetical protein GCM10019998_12580 [Tetragenococcus solitarius]|uniref:Uncharacterized protein n=1 Tax=Tetragenococcus solitarius TaxID=71453 RepID=A0ABN3Y462_9ENTE